jgi:hypothetical protein
MAHLRAVQHQQNNSTRIKELEDEIKRLTMENIKVKTELEKAQRRWERLKEGARRRRKDGNANGTIPEEREGSLQEVNEEREF